MAKKRGAPPKAAELKLSSHYLLKMTEAERAAYKAKAHAAGLPLGRWIRDRLNKAKK